MLQVARICRLRGASRVFSGPQVAFPTRTFPALISRPFYRSSIRLMDPFGQPGLGLGRRRPGVPGGPNHPSPGRRPPSRAPPPHRRADDDDDDDEDDEEDDDDELLGDEDDEQDLKRAMDARKGQASAPPHQRAKKGFLSRVFGIKSKEEKQEEQFEEAMKLEDRRRESMKQLRGQPNPLIQPGMTLFPVVIPEHLLTGLEAVSDRVSATLTALCRTTDISWEGLIHPYEDIRDLIDQLQANAAILALVQNHNPKILKFAARVEEGQFKLLNQVVTATAFTNAVAGLATAMKQDTDTKISPYQARVLKQLLTAGMMNRIHTKGPNTTKALEDTEKLLQRMRSRFANEITKDTLSTTIVLLDKKDVKLFPPQVLASAARFASAIVTEEAVKNRASDGMLVLNYRDFQLAKVRLSKQTNVRLSPEEQKLVMAAHTKKPTNPKSGEVPKSLQDIEDVGDNENLGTPVTTSATEGPWAFGLGQHSFLRFMSYCPREDLRELLYKAYNTRGESVIDGVRVVLELRNFLSSAAINKDFASYRLIQTLAGTPDHLQKQLEELAPPFMAIARHQLETLKRFATPDGQEVRDLKPSDIQFWFERWREKHVNVPELRSSRQYFPLPFVFQSLLNWASKLFDLNFERMSTFATMEEFEKLRTSNPEGHFVPVWHKDVGYVRVTAKATPSRPEYAVGGFYFDMDFRVGKSQKPVFVPCFFRRVRNAEREDGQVAQQVRMPIGALIASFQPLESVKVAAAIAKKASDTDIASEIPSFDKNSPSLLTFDDLRLLMRQFGGMMRHLLTLSDSPLISGSHGSEWDSVDIVPHVFELMLSDPDFLQSLSQHYLSQKPMPRSLVNDILRTHYGMSALFGTLQLRSAMVDLAVHRHRWVPSAKSRSIRKDYQAVLEAAKPALEATQLVPDVADPLLPMHQLFYGKDFGAHVPVINEMYAADIFSEFRRVGFAPEKMPQLKAVAERFQRAYLNTGGAVAFPIQHRNFFGRDVSAQGMLDLHSMFIKPPSDK